VSQTKKPPRSDEERRAARRERERRHREMREKGLRRVTTWVIDTSRSELIEEWRRQSQRISADPREQELAEILSSEQDFPDWKG
jgi:hypothetical protein